MSDFLRILVFFLVTVFFSFIFPIPDPSLRTLVLGTYFALYVLYTCIEYIIDRFETRLCMRIDDLEGKLSALSYDINQLIPKHEDETERVLRRFDCLKDDINSIESGIEELKESVESSTVAPDCR